MFNAAKLYLTSPNFQLTVVCPQGTGHSTYRLSKACPDGYAMFLLVLGSVRACPVPIRSQDTHWYLWMAQLLSHNQLKGRACCKLRLISRCTEEGVVLLDLGPLVSSEDPIEY